MRTPPVHYVTTPDGLSIAYTTEGSGTPLVWTPAPFHDVLANRRNAFIKSFLEAMAPRFQIVFYDHRGQGMSTRGLSPDHSWQDYQQDLEAVVDRLGLERFVLLCGIGPLGAVAVRYVVAHPERVEGFVLYNPTSLAREGREIAEGWARLAEGNWEFFLDNASRMSSSHDDPSALREMMNRSANPSDFVRMIRTILLPGAEPMLNEVKVATLVLSAPAGAWASSVTTEINNSVAARIPGARLVMVNNYPDDVFRAIEEFVNTLPSRWALPDGLSERELAVLRLIAAGRTNPQIAEELVISRNTVQNHVASILRKTELTNRTQAAVYARRHNL